MAEHAILNEETGELEVSSEVSALLDGMAEVLESEGYDIEAGMEAEEFIEQVYDVLETDKDLDDTKKQALIKSYNTVVEVIEAAHCEGDDCDDADDADADDADADDSGDDDSGDDDSGDDDKPAGDKPADKKDDDKKDDSKKPFFLKKKVDAEEAAEGEEQAESNVSSRLRGPAQKGYKPGGWKSYTHKPGKNAHGHYSIGAHNKGAKRPALSKTKRLPKY